MMQESDRRKKYDLSPVKSDRIEKTAIMCIEQRISCLGDKLLEGSLYEGSIITSESNYETTFYPEEE